MHKLICFCREQVFFSYFSVAQTQQTHTNTQIKHPQPHQHRPTVSPPEKDTPKLTLRHTVTYRRTHPQTNTQTERHSHRDRHSHTNTLSDTHSHRERHTHKQTLTATHTQLQTDTHTHKDSDHSDTHTQKLTPTHTHIQTHTHARGYWRNSARHKKEFMDYSKSTQKTTRFFCFYSTREQKGEGILAEFILSLLRRVRLLWRSEQTS